MLKTLALTLTLLLSFIVAACSSTSGTNAKIGQTTTNATHTAPTDAVQRIRLTLQKEYKIVVTGPTTLGAILNSLQMGFRTLAIQKRTGEVWTVLGAVKTEFSKFGGLLEKVQKNLQSAGDQLEEVMGKRTRAIERKLRQVEQLPHEESQKILPIDVEDDLTDY